MIIPIPKKRTVGSVHLYSIGLAKYHNARRKNFESFMPDTVIQRISIYRFVLFARKNINPVDNRESQIINRILVINEVIIGAHF
jgi:hypothetical protein